MNTSKRDEHLKRTNYIKLFACIGIIAIGLWILLKVENMMLSCLLAFTASYLLDPCVNYLERLQLNRLLATTLTFILGIIIFHIPGHYCRPLHLHSGDRFQIGASQVH